VASSAAVPAGAVRMAGGGRSCGRAGGHKRVRAELGAGCGGALAAMRVDQPLRAAVGRFDGGRSSMEGAGARVLRS